jgi:uncharacterized membrane protein
MENVSSTKTALKWGVILGVLFMIFGTITYVAELWKNSWTQLITYLLLIVIIYLGINEYKKNNESYLTIGQGISIGTLIAAISSMISGAFNFIYTTFVDTTFTSKMQDFTREKMLEDGKITEEQVDQIMEMTQKISSPGIMFILGILIFIFFGFIFSLIIGAILSKKRPVFK